MAPERPPHAALPRMVAVADMGAPWNTDERIGVGVDRTRPVRQAARWSGACLGMQ
jgi:hypothetical protein